MGAVELRNKIIKQFQIFIEDDSKLLALDGIFDSMTEVDFNTEIPEEHYKIVEERRRKHLSGETTGKSWQEVKQELKKKYGF